MKFREQRTVFISIVRTIDCNLYFRFFFTASNNSSFNVKYDNNTIIFNKLKLN